MLRTILLIEDEKGAAILFKRFAQTSWEDSRGKVELIHTHTLAEGKDILQTKEIDVILLDLTLTDSTQENSIKLIEDHHEIFPAIVVVTGDETMITRKRCIFAGARGFALKKHIFQSPNFFFAEIYNIFLEALRDKEKDESPKT